MLLASRLDNLGEQSISNNINLRFKFLETKNIQYYNPLIHFNLDIAFKYFENLDARWKIFKILGISDHSFVTF